MRIGVAMILMVVGALLLLWPLGSIFEVLTAPGPTNYFSANLNITFAALIIMLLLAMAGAACVTSAIWTLARSKTK